MSCTTDSAFFDTNILVYAYDESEEAKRKIAMKLVEGVFEGRTRGVLSNQVLSETFYVLTEKIGRPLKRDVAAGIIRKYALSEKWKKIDYDSSTALRAAYASYQYGAPFWDSLVAETMKENNVMHILTENKRDFEKIPGLKVENPFG